MRTELELAFQIATRATGRLVTMLVRGRGTRATIVEIAAMLEQSAVHLKRAAEKDSRR